MCLILLAYKTHPEYDLVLLANRDEFYDRPTTPADFWSDEPDLLAGRDLRAGGTWMGVKRNGRYAAVTNYREPRREAGNVPSRGALVADYLKDIDPPEVFLKHLIARARLYQGFNLLVGTPDQLCYFSNREGVVRTLEPGVYGLSNHLLDAPWFKVEQGKAALAQALSTGRLAPEDLLAILADRAEAPEDRLPDTGIGAEWERVLSPLFIASAAYGTRSSTVLLIDATGRVTFVERATGPSATPEDIRRFDFEIQPAQARWST